ncbi:MAG TPA: pilus assembly protein PilE, partial [Rhodocyclaceae bacterium]|nr:pilus assembly protein PilE [Rhodocyclaceae bacterium]
TPPDETTFTLQAEPQGAQASDSCGTLTLNQAGVRSPTTAGCWSR